MNFKSIFGIALFTFSSIQILAQDRVLLDQLRKEEQKTIEAIALYPEEERKVILTAATHPEVIVRIQNMQEKTAEEFRSLLSYLDEEDQKKVFNVARYNELIEDLTSGGRKKRKKELDVLLEDYPEEIRDQATYLNSNHFRLLEEINRQRFSSYVAFENMISEYPKDVQDAYRKLIMLPEVMGILSENLNMNVLLGDLYKSKPKQLLAELDSLNIVAAEQKSKELNDWKRTLEENPEAMSEYEQASRKFAQEQGYEETEYASSVPDRRATEIYAYGVSRPYDYWFGCPWWYAYDCWYPYPYWYHWGYYYGPGNTIVFVGLPSSYYLHWHFYYGSHLYYYPYFTDCIFQYYHGYPYSNTNITVVTNYWIQNESPNLPNNWLHDDPNRVDRIKEYGKFKMDYVAATRDRTDKIPTQREFLEGRANDYPSLKPVLKEKKAPARRPEVDRGIDPQTDRPVERKEPPVYHQEPRVIEKPQTRRQEIDRARDHHENTWERQRPPVRTVPPQPRPRPQVQPRPQVRPVPRQPTVRPRSPK